jgi:hypothetical protein
MFATRARFGVTYFPGRFSFPPKFLSPMAPFEPKTDSKEFEVENLDKRPSINPGEAAALTIRIWQRDANSDKAALTWKRESVLVYMIADLVAASHGRTAVQTPAAMAAHFDHSLQALVAAKRIQTAILEFLACRPGDCAGAAVLIHPAAVTGFSPAMAQGALRLAEPGQIILSQQIVKRFQELPGIELRAVAPLTTGGSEHTGLMELLWTSAERLASLRNTAPAAAPTATLDASFGATMIVKTSPAHTAGSQVDRADRSNTDSASAQAADGFSNRDAAFARGLAEFEEHRSFITPLRIGVATIGVVLVVAGLFLFHPWSDSNVRPKPQVHDEPAGSVAVPNEPASAVPQPPPVAQPAPELPTKSQPPVVVPPPVNNPPPQKNREKDKSRKPEDTIQGFEGSSTYNGMTQKDIPQLLQWARSDAGNGNYGKAAQEYRAILQLQPNNSDAREGLRKIQVAQGLDQ